MTFPPADESGSAAARELAATRSAKATATSTSGTSTTYLRSFPADMKQNGILITEGNFEELKRLLERKELSKFSDLLDIAEPELPEFDYSEFRTAAGLKLNKSGQPATSTTTAVPGAKGSFGGSKRPSPSPASSDDKGLVPDEAGASTGKSSGDKNAAGSADSITRCDPTSTNQHEDTTTTGPASKKRKTDDAGEQNSSQLSSDESTALIKTTAQAAPKFHCVRSNQFVFDCGPVQRAADLLRKYEKKQKLYQAGGGKTATGVSQLSDFAEVARLREETSQSIDTIRKMDFYPEKRNVVQRPAAVGKFNAAMYEARDDLTKIGQEMLLKVVALHKKHLTTTPLSRLPKLSVEVATLGGDSCLHIAQVAPHESAEFWHLHGHDVPSASEGVQVGKKKHTNGFCTIPVAEYVEEDPLHVRRGERADSQGYYLADGRYVKNIREKNRLTLDVELQHSMRLHLEKKVKQLFEALLAGGGGSSTNSYFISSANNNFVLTNNANALSSSSAAAGSTDSSHQRPFVSKFSDEFPVPNGISTPRDDVPYGAARGIVNYSACAYLDNVDTSWDIPRQTVNNFIDDLLTSLEEEEEKAFRKTERHRDEATMPLVDQERNHRERFRAQEQRRAEMRKHVEARRQDIRSRGGGFVVGSLLTAGLLQLGLVSDEKIAAMMVPIQTESSEPPVYDEVRGVWSFPTRDHAYGSSQVPANEAARSCPLMAVKKGSKQARKRLVEPDLKQLQTGDLFKLGRLRGAFGWRSVPYGADRALLLHLTAVDHVPGSLAEAAAPTGVTSDANVDSSGSDVAGKVEQVPEKANTRSKVEELLHRRRRLQSYRAGHASEGQKQGLRVYVCVAAAGIKSDASSASGTAGAPSSVISSTPNKSVSESKIVGYVLIPKDAFPTHGSSYYDPYDDYGYRYGRSTNRGSLQYTELADNQVLFPDSCVGMFIAADYEEKSGLELLTMREEKLQDAREAGSLGAEHARGNPMAALALTEFAKLLERRKELAIRKIDWFRLTYPGMFSNESAWQLLRTVLNGCRFGVHALGRESVLKKLAATFDAGGRLENQLKRFCEDMKAFFVGLKQLSPHHTSMKQTRLERLAQYPRKVKEAFLTEKLGGNGIQSVGNDEATLDEIVYSFLDREHAAEHRAAVEREKAGEERGHARRNAVTHMSDPALDALRPDFIFSEYHDGSRPGYVFKRGERGIGYYRDDYWPRGISVPGAPIGSLAAIASNPWMRIQVITPEEFQTASGSPGTAGAAASSGDVLDSKGRSKINSGEEKQKSEASSSSNEKQKSAASTSRKQEGGANPSTSSKDDTAATQSSKKNLAVSENTKSKSKVPAGMKDQPLSLPSDTTRTRVIQKVSNKWRFAPAEVVPDLQTDLRAYDNFFDYADQLEKALNKPRALDEEEEDDDYNDEEFSAEKEGDNFVGEDDSNPPATEKVEHKVTKLQFVLTIVDPLATAASGEEERNRLLRRQHIKSKLEKSVWVESREIEKDLSHDACLFCHLHCVVIAEHIMLAACCVKERVPAPLVLALC
ncbi:unnamed protein product [Amoebophrya sp. A120]|nr:unnamed protein product [Amoebophrya sp. A120]|eukprot:GSA120T00009406001.1